MLHLQHDYEAASQRYSDFLIPPGGGEVQRGYKTVNHHWPHKYRHGDIFKKIAEISNEGNWNNSDVLTDYFDVGWYFSLSIGD